MMGWIVAPPKPFPKIFLPWKARPLRLNPARPVPAAAPLPAPAALPALIVPLLEVEEPLAPEVVMAEFLPVLMYVGPLLMLEITEFPEATIPGPLLPFTFTAPLKFTFLPALIPWPVEEIPALWLTAPEPAQLGVPQEFATANRTARPAIRKTLLFIFRQFINLLLNQTAFNANLRFYGAFRKLRNLFKFLIKYLT